MPYYSVMLRGSNFPGDLIGESQKVGFYTTRWVRALTPKRAELKAVQLVWKDPMLDGLEYPDDPDEKAYIRLEDIQKIDKLPEFRGGGATWYVEEDD